MKKLLISAVALSILGSAGVASAQPYGNPRAEARQDLREAKRDVKEARRDAREARKDIRAAKRYRAGRYYAPRGYQARRFARGQRLPAAYRARTYYVDYGRYGLRAPPRGYQYVRVGNDVVLTAVATGLIASVVFDLFQ